MNHPPGCPLQNTSCHFTSCHFTLCHLSAISKDHKTQEECIFIRQRKNASSYSTAYPSVPTPWGTRQSESVESHRGGGRAAAEVFSLTLLRDTVITSRATLMRATLITSANMRDHARKAQESLHSQDHPARVIQVLITLECHTNSLTPFWGLSCCQCPGKQVSRTCFSALRRQTFQI